MQLYLKMKNEQKISKKLWNIENSTTVFLIH